MRAVNVTFYEVETRSSIPMNPQVGAMYFIKDEANIAVNHGDKVVYYSRDVKAVLDIAHGGTAATSAAAARDSLGVTSAIATVNSTITQMKGNYDAQLQDIKNRISALEQR